MRFRSLISYLAFALFMGCLIGGSASAMEVGIVQTGLPLRVELRGEVHAGDAARIIGVLEKAKPRDLMAKLQAKTPDSLYDPRQWLWLDVESPGGDLDETLALGRYLRSANALITTKEICASACVFLLAGAVERVGLAESQGRVVGVHRPYSTGARDGSTADFERLFDAVHAKIVDYLKEMRVSPLLAELMFATPPEEMYMLSADELEFLLPERDAAWDESTIARRAAMYGIPSAAYRQREVSARHDCERATHSADSLLAVADCAPAHSLGIPIDEFVAKNLLFSGQCAFAPGIYQVMRPGNSDFLSCAAGFAVPSAAAAHNKGGLLALILKLDSHGTPKLAAVSAGETAHIDASLLGAPGE